MRIKRTREISLEKLIWNNRVRKRINKRLTIGMLIFLLSFFVLFHAWQSLSPPLQNQVQIIGNVISEFSGEPTTALIDVDFNDEVGVVRGDFYGANTHGKFVSNDTLIDLMGDCTNGEPSNYTWHRQTILNSGIKILEVDLSENSWTNLSNGTFDLTIPYTLINGKETIGWARNNGIKVFLSGGNMPTYLQNITTDCDSNPSSCGPNNYIMYANLQLTAIRYLTNNGEWIDTVIGFTPYNEPHSALLKDISPYTNQNKKMAIYYQIYNTSRTIIKANLSSLPIGGPSGHIGWGTDNVTYIHWDWWFGNFTNQMDFVDFHIYRDDDLSSRYNTGIENILNNCSYYGGNCSKLFVTEFNVYSSLTKNQTSLENYYGSQIADFYTNALNHPEYNVSFVMNYQYANTKSYKNSSCYEEYPQRWSMVSEAGLDTPTPTYYPSYTVTKSFATYHSSGSMIVKSNSSLRDVKVVASEKDDNQYITVINTGNETNVSLILSGNSYSNVKDLETNRIYVSNNGVIDIGILNQYEIKYLISTNEVSAPIVNNPTSGGSSGGGGGGGSSSNSKINANEIYTSNNTENNEINNEAGENKDSNLDDNVKNKIETGKTAGTGKAILGGEGEKYVSGIIVLLVFGIIAVLIAILTILYFRSRRNNLEINNEMQDLNSFKEGEEIEEDELEKYGLEKEDLEKNELEEEKLEEEAKEGESEGEENQEPVLG